MTDDDEPEGPQHPDIEFTWVEGPGLAPGEWAWGTYEGGKTCDPYIRCPRCGYEMYLPARYEIGRTGIVATKSGRGFGPHRADGARTRCMLQGRYVLLGWAEHPVPPKN